jgi:hypothetical protein
MDPSGAFAAFNHGYARRPPAACPALFIGREFDMVNCSAALWIW